MQPIIIDRPAILAVVTSIVTTYVDAVNPPFVAWDVGTEGIGDGADYSRNDAGGGCIILSVRADREVGTTRSDWIQTPGQEGVVHTIVRNIVFSIKVESDVLLERDLALDIAETIRSRAYWQAWRYRFADAGLSILKTLSLVNSTSDWSGRKMSYATLDLNCLTSMSELDDDPESKMYATSVEVQTILLP